MDVAKLRAAVKQADVQRLFKQPVGPVTVNAEFNQCTWHGGDINITVHSGDDDRTIYNTIQQNAHHSPLSGVDDMAEWAYDPTMEQGSVPNVAAHKGTLTLILNARMAMDQTTLSYTGTQDTKIVIDPSSAAQYASEEGQLCTDMFGETS